MNTRRLLILIAILALLAVAIVVVPNYLTKSPSEKPVSELAVADGQIVSYSFLDDSRGLHQYNIRLSNYQANFQIPPEFIQYFAKTRFESTLKNGDYLSVSIAPDSAAKLVSGGPVPVFAIRTKTATYLDEHYTLYPQNHNADATKPSPGFASRRLLLSVVIAAASISFLIALALVIQKMPRKAPAGPSETTTLSDPEALQESTQRLIKIVAKSAAEHKPSDQPTCPYCGAPAKRVPLFNVQSASHQTATEQPGAEQNVAASTAESKAVSGHGLLPGKEVLRCTGCQRIIPEPEHPADQASSPQPVHAEDSSSH